MDFYQSWLVVLTHMDLIRQILGQSVQRFKFYRRSKFQFSCRKLTDVAVITVLRYRAVCEDIVLLIT